MSPVKCACDIHLADEEAEIQREVRSLRSLGSRLAELRFHPVTSEPLIMTAAQRRAQHPHQLGLGGLERVGGESGEGAAVRGEGKWRPQPQPGRQVGPGSLSPQPHWKSPTMESWEGDL